MPEAIEPRVGAPPHHERGGEHAVRGVVVGDDQRRRPGGPMVGRLAHDGGIRRRVAGQEREDEQVAVLGVAMVIRPPGRTAR